MQIKEDDVDQQRENIFHTRCHIQNKEFDDVFPEDIPNGLPPLRGIEHKVVKNAFLTRHGTYNINSSRKLES
jgi:hypothetical protein